MKGALAVLTLLVTGCVSAPGRDTARETLEEARASTPFTGVWDSMRGGSALKLLGYEVVLENEAGGRPSNVGSWGLHAFNRDAWLPFVAIEAREATFTVNLSWNQPQPPWDGPGTALPEWSMDERAREAREALTPRVELVLSAFEQRTGWQRADEPTWTYQMAVERDPEGARAG